MTDHDALEPSSEAMSIARMVHSLTASEGLVYAGKAIDEYLDAHYRNIAVDGRPTLPASDEMEAVAKLNLRRFIHLAKFKCEVDREAALNCLDVIEAEISELNDLVAVLRSAVAASDKVRENGDKDRANLVARPSDEVSVVQTDRDAAADYLVSAYPEAVRDRRISKLRHGHADDHPAVAAFARYRAALSAIPADPVVEALASAAREVLLDCANSNGRPHIPSGRKLMALSDALAAYRGK